MSELVVENRFLNDDCVNEILNFLTVPELSIAATVSKQFQEISQYIVKTKHNQINLRDEFRKITLDQFEILLENFANFLCKLTINVEIFPAYNDEREKKIFELISKNFNNDNHRLSELSFEHFKKLELIEFIGLLPTFRKVNTLKFKNVRIPITIPELLMHLKHLRYLQIIFCNPLGPLFLTIHEPRLFSTNIEKLDLRGNENLLTIYLLRNIEVYFPNLRELIFHTVLHGEHFSRQLSFHQDILKLANLPLLTKLSVDMEFGNVTPLLEKFVENNIQIKHLDINFACTDGSTLQALSQLQTIETLRLYGILNLNRKFILGIGNCLLNLTKIETNVVMSIVTLTKLVQSTPNTEYIDVKMNSAYKFNSRNYKQLLNVVMSRPKTNKLLIKIRNSDRKPISMKEKHVLKQGRKCEFLCIERQPTLHSIDL